MPLPSRSSLPSGIRALARWAWVLLLYYSGLSAWARWRLRRDGAVVVLMFHRVLANAEMACANSLGSIVVRDQTFDRLSRFLARHCQPVDLTAGAPPWQPTARVRVAMTFDDGWRDNASTAFPIFRRYQLPVAIFICPDLVGRNTPFWPERTIQILKSIRSDEARSQARRILSRFVGDLSLLDRAPLPEAALETVVEALKNAAPADRSQVVAELSSLTATEPFDSCDATMTWSQLEDLRHSGVTYGSHTQSHPILTQLPRGIVRKELVHSKAAIESRVGSPCSLLAYPNGSLSDDVREEAARAGYTVAFTTQPGHWTAATDPLRVPRVNMSESNLIDPLGRFSRAMAEYAIFWKAYRARRATAA